MIQPIDIKTTSFKKGLFGYNKMEVDSFKDSVYKAYDDAVSENNRLSEENERLKKAIEDSRLKIFDLENKNGNGSGGDNAADSEKAKKIIEEAQKSAADIIARAKAESDRIVGSAKGDAKAEKKAETKAEPKAEPAKEEKASATSKFFKEAEEKAADVFGDDDEVFVGEIEDNRKPSKVMIGDGEEEEDADFEFL
ncbi:MAG: DivIVA domain-containing protein [Eubacterium sp.]|nr:DivIVA domain-containing protein [Eubacterium sp.]